LRTEGRARFGMKSIKNAYFGEIEYEICVIGYDIYKEKCF